MERYEKFLPLLDHIIAATNALLDGRRYGSLETDDGELLADTQTIQESTLTLREHIASLNTMPDAKISALAHDLRGMMNGVLGWTEIIVQGLDGDLTETQQTVYEGILRDGQTALLQVDLLIDFARLNLGTLPINLEAVNVHDVVEPEMRLYRTHVPQKVTLMLPDDLGLIYTDGVRLKQMLFHVAQNAHRHGEPTEVTLSASTRDGFLDITIQDNGRGIPPEHLPRVTEPFYQVDEASGGLGLGLAFVQGLATRQGGALRVKSGNGHAGTAVTIRLPCVD